MKNIAVVFSFNSELAWQTYLGVSRYSARKDNWVLQRLPHSFLAEKPLAEWNLAGLIAATHDPQHLEKMSRMPFPAICIGNTPHPDVPNVMSDDALAARMAADYFVRAGFQSFAHLPAPFAYLQTRITGFTQAVEQHGFQSVELTGLIKLITGDQNARAGEMLRALQKPVAVYCPYDELAFLLCRFCRQHRLRIPEDISIMGTQDEITECERITPAISSVHIPYFQKGFKAAELLDLKMRGRKVPGTVLFKPTHITVRQSTDTLAVCDDAVRKALIYLREHYREKISIRDLALHTGIARRSLERRFAETLQDSPLNVLLGIRIEKAAGLLRETALPLDRIAEQCGFGSGPYLNQIFRKTCGQSPSAYRREHSARSAE